LDDFIFESLQNHRIITDQTWTPIAIELPAKGLGIVSEAQKYNL